MFYFSLLVPYWLAVQVCVSVILTVNCLLVEEPKNVVDGMAIDALERFGIREEQKLPFLGKYVLVKCLTFLFYF